MKLYVRLKNLNKNYFIITKMKVKKMNKPIKQFELFYSEETQETSHPYGDITSDLWAYRLVANVYEDKTVLIQYEAGRVGEYIEWETVEPFDLHFK